MPLPDNERNGPGCYVTGTSMARQRTFVAIDLNAEVRRRAKTLLTALSRTTSGVRWVAPDQLHVTLKFLGDVDDTRFYAVCEAVRKAVRGRTPFSLACRGVGAFPDLSRPRTVWLGLDDPEGQLADLQAEVERQLRTLDFPEENRPFRAHVTLGRVQEHARDLESLQAALEDQADFDARWLTVESCTVYASELRRAGPVYSVLGRIALGG